MSDTPPPPPAGDEPDVTAAELAVGLLEGEERAAALRRVLADPAFAAEVAAWRDRLGDLFAAWPDAEPAPGGLERLERALDGTPAPVAATPRRAAGFWRAATGISSLAAAALALFIVLRPAGPAQPPLPSQSAAAPATPMLMAAIAPVGTGQPAAALYDPATGMLSIAPADMDQPGHSAQLWLIGKDGVPHALGLMAHDGRSEIRLTPENLQRIGGGAVIAVSLEPEGGSPTGAPTGPVIAKGELSSA